MDEETCQWLAGLKLGLLDTGTGCTLGHCQQLRGSYIESQQAPLHALQHLAVQILQPPTAVVSRGDCTT